MSCKKCLNKYNKINRQPFILIPCGHTFCSQCINDFQSCYNCLSDINNKILNQDLFDLLNQDLYNLLSQREALEHLNKLESNEKKIEIKLNIIKNNLNNSESVEINRILESAEHEIENNLKHLDNIDFESHLKSNDWLSKNGIIIGPADASFTSSNALEITHVILNH